MTDLIDKIKEICHKNFADECFDICPFNEDGECYFGVPFDWDKEEIERLIDATKRLSR